MASPVGFTTSRPKGASHSVERVQFGGKSKKLALSKGLTANRATLIGDSIIQRMLDMWYTSVQGIPGAYLRDMVQMCRDGIYDIRSFTAVVVLCGTNDYSSNITHKELLDRFTAIIQHIRLVNPTARIGICGILPRPCDAKHPSTNHRIKDRLTFNTALLLHCRAAGVTYIKTDKAFKGKGPDSFIYHTDFLHLSKDGLEILKSWLQGVIGCLIGSAPQHTPQNWP
jgi:hypothetical protein